MTTVSSPAPSFFPNGYFPEDTVYKALEARTRAVELLYERDVTQISRFLSKHSKEDLNPSLFLENLTKTIATLGKIIEDTKQKCLSYKTNAFRILCNFGEWTTPLHGNVYDLAGLGILSGVGSCLVNEAQTSSKTNTSNLESAPPRIGLIGWISFALTVVAITASCVKNYVDHRKKEQKQLEDLLEKNKEMETCHKIVHGMLTQFQASIETEKNNKPNPNELSKKFQEELKEKIIAQKKKVPDYLQNACQVSSIERALKKMRTNHTSQ